MLQRPICDIFAFVYYSFLLVSAIYVDVNGNKVTTINFWGSIT